MSEQNTIDVVTMPRTRQSLADDLRALGLKEGMTVIVHSSLSSLGWVCGGAVAVVQALMDVLTEEGTLVMPTHSSEFSDPALWQNPPVPKEWHEIIRETMPAFDPLFTPTRNMGKIVDTFRTFPGVLRSNHPHVSFAAWGKHKELVTDNHSLDYGLGDRSPLARIYDLDGYVLLLGVGHDRNTSLHLSENRAPGTVKEMLGSPIIRDGQRVWATFAEIEIDSDQFPEAGEQFEAAHPIQSGKVGSADAKLIGQRALVDFGTAYFAKKRGF
ncbi:aminoglycoside 3-N-acetyltransferase [Tumebacillus sp. BK434]|uniref:aminoglycoside N(3)-acetyltransferase n=1 Tax=Tumebacillus sp. BK434 TaxID=2512169 RepID=UPI00104E5D59|nr:AAC(3) family N-acetyltransferase [Tumebacillus sp. BK434]TCP52767.1 aminoglycoside 3-N-acetyltransferase [Tumebacillus sp. BK434]